MPTLIAISVLAAGCAAETPAATTATHVAHCSGGQVLSDGSADGRSWTFPARSSKTPASADLQRFDVRADAAGVCAHFTVAAPLRVGTELVLSIHGPVTTTASGGTMQAPYGFSATLEEGGTGTATFGSARAGTAQPNRLRAQVRWSGSDASVVVPISEVNRAPDNMPGRAPLALHGFGFQARVISPADHGSQSVDFAPDERVGEATYP